MKKFLFLIFVFAFLLSLGTQFYHSSFFFPKWLKFSPADQPFVRDDFANILSARSWIVVDLESGAVLAQKDAKVAFAPASLTKIATALVALDNYELDQVLSVEQEYPIGRQMGLKKGEEIKVIDLISGLLIHSANDAAYVLAQNYPGGSTAFIAEMNNWVKNQGLSRTHFVNFSGEEDENHFSTAQDLALLSRVFWQKPVLRQLVELERKTVSDIGGGVEHRLQTTNKLLSLAPESRGLKTGWTEQAGECFVGLFEIGRESGDSRFLITVILGSEDRFGETLQILNWAKEKVTWESYSETHSIEIAETKAEKL